MRTVTSRSAFLGSSALVAAGLCIGEARAEFDVTVNGSWNTAYGFVGEDDGDDEAGDGRQNQAINQDWEVHFRAQQTLDNGIVVGGRVEMEGATNNGDDVAVGPTDSGSAGSDQIDERWLYFRGGFGEIRVGDEDDARKLMAYTAPDPTNYLFGVNSPLFTFKNTGGTGQVVSTNTTTPFDGDSTKIIYFTPTFSGFQLALSYAPDSTQDRSSFGTGGTNDAGQVSNYMSIGANWSDEFSGVTLGAGGGYSSASSETGGDDPKTWAVGVNVGFAGFTVGGSIAMADDTTDVGYNGYSVSEATVFDLGAIYAFESATVGIGWSHGEYEDATEVGDDELDFVNLGGSYTLGPGVLFAAFVGWFDYDDGGPTDNDNTGWQTGVGVGLDF
jgi:hypothetical protein